MCTRLPACIYLHVYYLQVWQYCIAVGRIKVSTYVMHNPGTVPTEWNKRRLSDARCGCL